MASYKLIISGSLGKRPEFGIDSGSERIQIIARRKIRFNLYFLLKHVRLQYAKSNLGLTALLAITARRLGESYQLYRNQLMSFLFLRYVIKFELSQKPKHPPELKCTTINTTTPAWVSRYVQMKGIGSQTRGQELEWDMFRGSDSSRVYVLDIEQIDYFGKDQEEDKGVIPTLKDEKLSGVNKPSNDELRLIKLKNIIVDRTQFVVSNSIATPVHKFDYFEESSQPTQSVFCRNQEFRYFPQYLECINEVEDATLIPYSTNWYHFLVEGLGAYFSCEGILRKSPIVITDQCHRNIRNLATVVTGKNPIVLQNGHGLKVQNLQLIQEWRFRNRFDFFERGDELRLLSSRLKLIFPNESNLESRDNFEKTESGVLFVIRPNGLFRPMINMGHAKDTLGSMGILVVDPLLIDIDHFAGLLSHAKCVVIETGAAMTNLLFAKKGCIVIEVNPKGVEPDFWRSFCMSLNLNHYLVEAKAVPGTRGTKFHFPIRSVVTQLKKLRVI